MKNTLANTQKDDQGKDDLLDSLHKEPELSGENDLDSSELKSRRLVRKVNSQRTLILNVKQFLTCKRSIKNLLLRSTRGFDTKIPMHMATPNERYLRRCLELIHSSAAKSAQCDISVNLGSAKMGILWDDIDPVKIRTDDTCDLTRFVFECPSAAGTGSVVISPAGQWIVGSIMGSKSMINILKSPLLSKLGSLDGDDNLKRISLNKGSLNYDFMSSPGEFSSYSSLKIEKQSQTLGNHKQGFETGHKQFFPMSSSNSTCSDQSSSSSSASTSLGVLQCMWNGGSPHFVYSIDDRKEVFVANLSKIESADDKSLDYMYSFYWRKGGQKEHEIHDNESSLIGKMKVSIFFTVCPNNSKIMETQFTLLGSGENIVGGMQTSGHAVRKSKGLSKKVVQVFRMSHSIKQRTFSKFGGSSDTQENSSWEQCLNTSDNVDAICSASLSENHLPPNLELAAIVVKEHLPSSCQKEVGGWGLKFLRKGGVKPTVETLKTSAASACCTRDNGDCSISMDIIIPAGFHGGPRTRNGGNGGPSGLIERWRSGGCCDCGGWDLGCPLTLLSCRSSRKEVLSRAEMNDECKSFDLFIQGSQCGASTLRMMNVRDDLYFIHFQSNLSALQSFSIAVASIHSQSASLRPKNVQELN